jgi:hypothetical protein
MSAEDRFGDHGVVGVIALQYLPQYVPQYVNKGKGGQKERRREEEEEGESVLTAAGGVAGMAGTAGTRAGAGANRVYLNVLQVSVSCRVLALEPSVVFLSTVLRESLHSTVQSSNRLCCSDESGGGDGGERGGSGGGRGGGMPVRAQLEITDRNMPCHNLFYDAGFRRERSESGGRSGGRIGGGSGDGGGGDGSSRGSGNDGNSNTDGDGDGGDNGNSGDGDGDGGGGGGGDGGDGVRGSIDIGRYGGYEAEYEVEYEAEVGPKKEHWVLDDLCDLPPVDTDVYTVNVEGEESMMEGAVQEVPQGGGGEKEDEDDEDDEDDDEGGEEALKEAREETERVLIEQEEGRQETAEKKAEKKAAAKAAAKAENNDGGNGGGNDGVVSGNGNGWLKDLHRARVTRSKREGSLTIRAGSCQLCAIEEHGGNGSTLLRYIQQPGKELGSHVWGCTPLLCAYLARRYHYCPLHPSSAFSSSIDMDTDTDPPGTLKGSGSDGAESGAEGGEGGGAAAMAATLGEKRQGSMRDPCRALRVVELGAGLGLCGMYLGLRGARVTLTDLPKLIPLLEENVKLNAGEVRREKRLKTKPTSCTMVVCAW